MDKEHPALERSPQEQRLTVQSRDLDSIIKLTSCTLSTIMPTHSTNSLRTKQSDITNKLGNDGKLTPSERERRHMGRLCLYCGLPGHIAVNCRKSAKSKARSALVESPPASNNQTPSSPLAITTSAPSAPASTIPSAPASTASALPLLAESKN